MDTETALTQLGLSPNEGAIYLFLVRNGARYATQIQAALELEKVPTYRVLNSLKAKGFVESIGETRNQQFVAQPLTNLLGEYDMRISQLATARLDIEALARDLTTQQQELYKERKITTYEGIEGYRLFNEARLAVGTDVIREFGRSEFLEQFFGPEEITEYMNAYIKRRVKRGIPIKTLGAIDELRPDYDRTSPEMLKESRIVHAPQDMLAFFSTFGSRFGFYTKQGGDYLGVIIDDPIMTTMMVTLFDALWDKGQQV